MLNLIKMQMPALLFADDAAAVVEIRSRLQSFIDIVRNNTKCWCFESNVKKMRTIVSFSMLGKVSGDWIWSHERFPIMDFYCYLGVKFNNDGSYTEIYMILQ